MLPLSSLYRDLFKRVCPYLSSLHFSYIIVSIVCTFVVRERECPRAELRVRFWLSWRVAH